MTGTQVSSPCRLRNWSCIYVYNTKLLVTKPEGKNLINHVSTHPNQAAAPTTGYITFFTPFFHIHTTNITHIDTYIFNLQQFFSFSFFFYLFLVLFCRLFVIEDFSDLTSPPLPAANKQRSSSNSSRGTGTVNLCSMTASSFSFLLLNNSNHNKTDEKTTFSRCLAATSDDPNKQLRISNIYKINVEQAVTVLNLLSPPPSFCCGEIHSLFGGKIYFASWCRGWGIAWVGWL